VRDLIIAAARRRWIEAGTPARSGSSGADRKRADGRKTPSLIQARRGAALDPHARGAQRRRRPALEEVLEDVTRRRCRLGVAARVEEREVRAARQLAGARSSAGPPPLLNIARSEMARRDRGSRRRSSRRSRRPPPPRVRPGEPPTAALDSSPRRAPRLAGRPRPATPACALRPAFPDTTPGRTEIEERLPEAPEDQPLAIIELPVYWPAMFMPRVRSGPQRVAVLHQEDAVFRRERRPDSDAPRSGGDAASSVGTPRDGCAPVLPARCTRTVVVEVPSCALADTAARSP
jgi:hypothetical protein